MPSRAEFLSAICAAPDDDAPRLAFAAWIEARDPGWAAIIRRQCAAAGGPAAAEDDAHVLAALGLAPGEGVIRRGLLEGVEIGVSRASRLLAGLAEQPLRRIDLRVDLGGNDEELSALVPELAALTTLRELEIDRRAHWDHRVRDDALRLDPADGGLALTLGEAAPPRPLVALLRRVLAGRRGLRAIAIDFAARGRVDADEVLDALVAGGPLPALTRLDLAFVDQSCRDWMRWLECRRLAPLLAACPALERLSLPMASITLDAIDHRRLRDLELGWLGMTPLGPADPDDDGRGPRASGLDFLRAAELPALERLAIDYQFEWYIPWSAADHRAPVEAPLPGLRDLTVRYSGDGDPLCEGLADAPFAATLERLELVGSEITDRGVAALLAARARLPRLRSLVTLQPLDVSDEAWAELVAAFPVDQGEG